MRHDVDVKPVAPAGWVGWLPVLAAAGLLLAFAGPLVEWWQWSQRDGLASHTPLVPVVCAYLIWLRKDRLRASVGGARWPAVVVAAAGLGVLAVPLAAGDLVPARVFAFCLLAWAWGVAVVGARGMRAIAFPAAFLVFVVPLPAVAVQGIETFFQHTSAAVAFRFIEWSGTPVYRDGLTFAMPGLTVFVGPECSGIRSSFVLFITSLLAGHLFLRSRWHRLWAALFVVPLGIVRNAFRVFVLSMLSVHVDPWWIESPLHHQGGPIFFVLSLGPFFVFLWWLRRRERRGRRVS